MSNQLISKTKIGGIYGVKRSRVIGVGFGVIDGSYNVICYNRHKKRDLFRPLFEFTIFRIL